MPGKDMFIRNVPGMTEKLMRSTVGIAGCGGLGSNAAVALTRAGIGTLVLADFDVVEASNLNRQYYFQSDIGRKKTEALAAHLHAINPGVRCILVDKRLSAQDISGRFSAARIMIEAFDRAEEKVWLVEAWRRAFPDRPIICASGVSGVGGTGSIAVRNTGMVYMVGDGVSDMSIGLCSARVAIAANMQANIAIEILVS